VRVCCRVAGVEVGRKDQAIVIAPSEEVSLPLAYRFRDVPELDTPIELEFWVSDAGSASAPLSLQLEEVILAPLDVRPRLELRMKSKMTAGRRSAFRVTVRNPGDSPVTVTAHTCSMGETWGSTPVTVRPHRVGSLKGFVVPSANALGTGELRLGLQWQTPEMQGAESVVAPVTIVAGRPTKRPIRLVGFALGLLVMLLVVGGLLFTLGHPGSGGETAPGAEVPAPQPPQAPPLEPVLQQAWTLHRQAQDRGVIELLSSHESDLQTSQYFAEAQMLLGWSYAGSGNTAAARTAFMNYWQCTPADDGHRPEVREALSRLNVGERDLPPVLGNCAPTLSWQMSPDR